MKKAETLNAIRKFVETYKTTLFGAKKVVNDDTAFETTVARFKNWYFFSKTYDTYLCWMPMAVANMSIDAAEKYLAAHNDVRYTNEDCTFNWYNVTANRLYIMSRVLDKSISHKSKTKSVKATSLGAAVDATTEKLTAKIEELQKQVAELKKYNSDTVTKINKDVSVKRDVAFVDMSSDDYDDVCDVGSCDFYWDEHSSCCSENAIDHAINMLKKKSTQSLALVKTLEAAKAKGAKYVIDSDYASIEDFKF